MPPPLLLLLFSLSLPLATFLLLTLAGRRMGTAVSGIVGTASTILAFTSSILALMSWLNGGTIAGEPWGTGRAVLRTGFAWAPIADSSRSSTPSGSPDVSLLLGLHCDSLTILIAMAGLMVSCAAHLFTTGYLRNDVRGPRTFALLSLCDAALVGLATAASLPQWAVWSVVMSVAGYLLAVPVPLGPGGLGITPVPRGLTPDDIVQRAASSLGLLIVRLTGDVCIMLACALLARAAPSLSWASIWAAGAETAPHSAVLLLIIAAVCHAAAFPVSLFWPEAKGFPTPIAAMAYGVHLLPAGVLLLVRIFPLFSPAHLSALAIIGALTLLTSVLAAIAESDLRRLFAWIAVAGIGSMFCAVGVGSIGGAMLHLIASMFGITITLLATGSVIHACLGERRLSHYGGLFFRMPATALLLAHGVGTLLGGPLLAGSGSWNTMMSHAYRSVQAGEWRGWVALSALGVGLPLMALAAGRGWSLIFLARPRDRTVYAAARESATLTVPVALLALLATVSGHPVWSPVRQLILVTPAEIASVATAGAEGDTPSPPSTYTGLALAREIAPPVAPPPPAPEDKDPAEQPVEVAVPPDDKTPKLIDPIRWSLGFAAAALGLIWPRILRKGRSGGRRGSVRAALAKGGYVASAVSLATTRAVSAIALLLAALESFLLWPIAAAASRIALPLWRKDHSPQAGDHEPFARERWRMSLQVLLAALMIAAVATFAGAREALATIAKAILAGGR